MRFSLQTPVAALACFLAAAVVAQAGDVDALIQTLGGDDQAACIEAMDELADEGRLAKPAVPALIEALGSDDVEIVWHAARTLAAIGPDAADAVPALTEALSHESTKVQPYAAYALGRIGKAAAPAAEALLDRVFAEDLQVRRVSLNALLAIDPPPEKVRPVLTKLLAEGEPALVASVLQTYAEQGKEIVPRLCEALEEEGICYWACIVLGDIGPDAAEAIPHVTKLLSHADPDVRMQALITLGEIGEASASVVPQIVDAINADEFDAVKFAGAFALGKIGVTGDESMKIRILKAVLKVAKSEDAFLHLVGVWALVRLDPEREGLAEYAAGEIAAALQSDNPQLQAMAAKAIAEFPASAERVGPVLAEALKDADPAVVGHVADAVAALGPKILPKVCERLMDPQARHLAAKIIIRMGPDAAESVPALIEALKAAGTSDDDLDFRREAKMALAMIGPQAKDAVPVLIEGLASDDQEVRGLACYALGKIGPAAADAAPALHQRLQELQGKDQIAVIWALLEIMPDDKAVAEAAMPLLTEALGTEDELVREEAARSLGKLGDAAKPAAAKLKELLDDPSPAVQQAAAESLEAIGT